jgi:protein SCO1
VSRSLPLAALLLVAAAVESGAPPAQVMPTPLKNVGYDQRLGVALPLSTPVRDEAGREVTLGSFFGKRPVVLALAYYSCPMLCNVVLDDLAASLKVVPFTAGKDYDVVVVSFDPRDTPALAAAKKTQVVANATFARDTRSRTETAAAWHFLTAAPTAIAAITQAVGFHYYWDTDTHQFAHAAGIVLLTPSGKTSRYFYGVEYPAKDVRLGLVEASGERIGSVVDQVLLYCFHYNPVIGRYSAVTLNIVRLGGAVTVVGLLLMVALLRLRERYSLGRA